MTTTQEYIRLLRDYKRKHAAGYGRGRTSVFLPAARQTNAPFPTFHF
ncbi:MAG: hypothetical protein LBD91_02375 [Prevotellaceae bacterium]|nr:hypothetical protein [Prevotellaceae bacterium]